MQERVGEHCSVILQDNIHGPMRLRRVVIFSIYLDPFRRSQDWNAAYAAETSVRVFPPACDTIKGSNGVVLTVVGRAALKRPAVPLEGLCAMKLAKLSCTLFSIARVASDEDEDALAVGAADWADRVTVRGVVTLRFDGREAAFSKASS